MKKYMKVFLFGSGDIAKKIYIEKNKWKKIDFFWGFNSTWDKNWSDSKSISAKKLSKSDKNSFQIKNRSELISVVDKIKPDIGLVIGSRWIFDEDFFSKFSKGVFNYHPSNLPKYKGAGGLTWQVLNKEKESFVTIHEMVKNIDSGKIILQKKIKLKNNPSLLEFSKSVQNLSIKTILDFFSKINKGETFEKNKYNKHISGTYFPLLDTNINGAINWDWEGKDIESFVNGFSRPYNGAFTYVTAKKNKIRILDCKFKKTSSLHPYTFGIILDKTEKAVYVSVKNGVLKINEVVIENNLKNNPLRLGSRLWTPHTELEKSLFYRPKNEK